MKKIHVNKEVHLKIGMEGVGDEEGNSATRMAGSNVKKNDP